MTFAVQAMQLALDLLQRRKNCSILLYYYYFAYYSAKAGTPCINRATYKTLHLLFSSRRPQKTMLIISKNLTARACLKGLAVHHTRTSFHNAAWTHLYVLVLQRKWSKLQQRALFCVRYKAGFWLKNGKMPENLKNLKKIIP